MKKSLKLALTSTAAALFFSAAMAQDIPTQVDYAKTANLASACGASDVSVNALKQSARSFFSKALTPESFPHVITETARYPEEVLRDSGLSCSQALLKAGTNAALMDIESGVMTLTRADQEGQVHNHGRQFYAAINQCYLASDRAQLIETFRTRQIQAAFGDRPGLQEIALKNSAAHAPFTGWSAALAVDPRECSDALVAAGRSFALVGMLAQ